MNKITLNNYNSNNRKIIKIVVYWLWYQWNIVIILKDWETYNIEELHQRFYWNRKLARYKSFKGFHNKRVVVCSIALCRVQSLSIYLHKEGRADTIIENLKRLYKSWKEIVCPSSTIERFLPTIFFTVERCCLSNYWVFMSISPVFRSNCFHYSEIITWARRLFIFDILRLMGPYCFQTFFEFLFWSCCS